MSLHVVRSAEPLPGFRARITFADGYTGEIDLRPALRGPALESLLDEDAFGEMRVEYDTICWPSGADIAPETLRFWCEMGRVTTERETEAFFSEQLAARVAEES